MGLRRLTGSADLPDLAGYLRLWSAGHGGYDPRTSFWVHGWLRLTYRAALPFARRGVPPDALTALGVLVCAAVPLLAWPGAGWPLLAVPVIVASGLVDGVDGAVAVLAGRATRFGAVLDGVADRAGEAGYLLALWLLGAPAWLCVLGRRAGVAPGVRAGQGGRRRHDRGRRGDRLGAADPDRGHRVRARLRRARRPAGAVAGRGGRDRGGAAWAGLD